MCLANDRRLISHKSTAVATSNLLTKSPRNVLQQCPDAASSRRLPTAEHICHEYRRVREINKRITSSKTQRYQRLKSSLCCFDILEKKIHVENFFARQTSLCSLLLQGDILPECDSNSYLERNLPADHPRLETTTKNCFGGFFDDSGETKEIDILAYPSIEEMPQSPASPLAIKPICINSSPPPPPSHSPHFVQIPVVPKSLYMPEL